MLPLPHIKWLIWVDPETGELGSKRRSGRRGSFYDAFWELYKIQDYLGREGVSVLPCACRPRRIPLAKRLRQNQKAALNENGEAACRAWRDGGAELPEDYGLFIPKSIFSEFTADEFALAAGIAAKYAWSGLKVLEAAGCIELAGKAGQKEFVQDKGLPASSNVNLIFLRHN